MARDVKELIMYIIDLHVATAEYEKAMMTCDHALDKISEVMARTKKHLSHARTLDIDISIPLVEKEEANMLYWTTLQQGILARKTEAEVLYRSTVLPGGVH